MQDIAKRGDTSDMDACPEVKSVRPKPSGVVRVPILWIITLTGLLLPGTAGMAHDKSGEHTVTPANEKRMAPPGAPSLTTKVGVQSLGSVDLSREFSALNGRMLRTRRITIAPGGSVAWHQHQQRPGVAYIVEGSLIEVRDDGSGPQSILRSAGDAVFESTEVMHGWRNDSDQTATAVVIDLVPEPRP